MQPTEKRLKEIGLHLTKCNQGENQIPFLFFKYVVLWMFNCEKVGDTGKTSNMQKDVGGGTKT